MGAGDLEAVRMVIPLLAHMGGIDEIGIFVIPALLAIYVLRRAERRSPQASGSRSRSSDDTVDDGRPGGDRPPAD